MNIHVDDKTVVSAIKDYKDGKSLKYLHDKYKVSHGAIYNWLNKTGVIPIRKKKNWDFIKSEINSNLTK